MNIGNCEKINRFILSVITVLGLMPTIALGGEVFPGKICNEPYAGLSDGNNALIAIQTYGYMYATNCMLSTTDNSVLTNSTYLDSPEEYISRFVRAVTSMNDLLFVNKVGEGEEIGITVGIYTNSSSPETRMTFILMRTNQTYISLLPTTNADIAVDHDAPFFWAYSLHPFDPYVYCDSYPCANTNGMAKMEFGIGSNDCAVFAKFTTNTWQIVGDMLSSKPELSRIVSLALSDDVTNFVSVFSSERYPQLLQSDFTNDTPRYESAMRAWQEPDKLCLLTSIDGQSNVIDFVMPVSMQLDTSKVGLVQVLKFVKEGADFALTPRFAHPINLDTNDQISFDKQELKLGSLDNMLDSELFCKGVVKYVMTTPPYASFAESESTMYSILGTSQVAVVLSWASKTQEIVEVIASITSNHVESIFYNTSIQFNAGETSSMALIPLSPILGGGSNSIINIKMGTASSGLRVAANSHQKINVINVNRPPSVHFSDSLALAKDLNMGSTNRISLPVVLDYPWTNAISVEYCALNGTATNNINYILVPGNLQFEPLATNKMIDISILGSGSFGEGSVFFKVVLTNAHDAEVGTLNVQTLVIH